MAPVLPVVLIVTQTLSGAAGRGYHVRGSRKPHRTERSRPLRIPALTLGVCLAVAVCATVKAQEVGPEELKARYEKKLAKDFIKKVKWERGLDEAMKQAKKKKKPILAYFTRSYAK